MTHGGARKGAGRPATPINESRIAALRKDGMSMAKIAERFGVSQSVIRTTIKRMKSNEQ